MKDISRLCDTTDESKSSLLGSAAARECSRLIGLVKAVHRLAEPVCGKAVATYAYLLGNVASAIQRERESQEQAHLMEATFSSSSSSTSYGAPAVAPISSLQRLIVSKGMYVRSGLGTDVPLHYVVKESAHMFLRAIFFQQQQQRRHQQAHGSLSTSTSSPSSFSSSSSPSLLSPSSDSLVKDAESALACLNNVLLFESIAVNPPVSMFATRTIANDEAGNVYEEEANVDEDDDDDVDSPSSSGTLHTTTLAQLYAMLTRDVADDEEAKRGSLLVGLLSLLELAWRPRNSATDALFREGLHAAEAPYEDDTETAAAIERALPAGEVLTYTVLRIHRQIASILLSLSSSSSSSSTTTSTTSTLVGGSSSHGLTTTTTTTTTPTSTRLPAALASVPDFILSSRLAPLQWLVLKLLHQSLAGKGHAGIARSAVVANRLLSVGGASFWTSLLMLSSPLCPVPALRLQASSLTSDLAQLHHVAALTRELPLKLLVSRITGLEKLMSGPPSSPETNDVVSEGREEKDETKIAPTTVSPRVIDVLLSANDLWKTEKGKAELARRISQPSLAKQGNAGQFADERERVLDLLNLDTR